MEVLQDLPVFNNEDKTEKQEADDIFDENQNQTPSIIKIDLDCELDVFLYRFGVMEHLGLDVSKIDVYNTNHGFHLYLHTTADIEKFEILAIEQILGDDFRRGLFNYTRILNKAKNCDILFRRKYGLNKIGDTVLLSEERYNETISKSIKKLYERELAENDDLTALDYNFLVEDALIQVEVTNINDFLRNYWVIKYLGLDVHKVEVFNTKNDTFRIHLETHNTFTQMQILAIEQILGDDFRRGLFKYMGIKYGSSDKIFLKKFYLHNKDTIKLLSEETWNPKNLENDRITNNNELTTKIDLLIRNGDIRDFNNDDDEIEILPVGFRHPVKY